MYIYIINEEHLAWQHSYNCRFLIFLFFFFSLQLELQKTKCDYFLSIT